MQEKEIKTYGHSAESHKKTRKLQKENADKYHHPQEKLSQLEKLSYFIKGDILEVFAGDGNLSSFYQKRGNLTALTKETTGDSFKYIYNLRKDRKLYDVIDIDSYGYPDKFFPLVFEMMKEESLLIFTFPIVGVNCLNGIMEQHYISYWRSDRPTPGDVTGVLTDMALRNWYLIGLIDLEKIKRIWRFAFMCKSVKATEFCNVRNR